MSKTRPFIKLFQFTLPEKLGWIALIVGHTIAAYTSYGYHHPDEYYQILEWANAFLGLGDPTKLAWEYAAQIRPWFQPLLHAGFMKAFLALGIYNPFTSAFFFQLGYAYLNLWSLSALWKYFKDRYTLNPWWFFWIACVWFFPYAHVRTSSENLAGIFISFGLLAILQNRRFWFAGALFGFAFLARYQIALGLAGMGLGLIVLDKKITRDHWKLFGGFLIPIALGVILDRIGYGNWVLTPYRYFKVNLIDGIAATYNPYPWYQYILWIVQLNAIVSIPLLAGSAWFLKKAKPDDRWIMGSFVWSFFLLHCLITNKEYRFLFPIINLIPFMTAVAFRDWGVKLAKPVLWVPYLVINLFTFSISTLHGASIKTMGALYLAHRHVDLNRTVLSSRDYLHQSPYFTIPAHELVVIHSPEQLRDDLNRTPNAQVLLDGLYDEGTLQLKAILSEKGCKLIDAALPEKLFQFQDRFPFLRKTPFVAWYDCKK